MVGVDDVVGIDGLYYGMRKEAQGPPFYLMRRRQLLFAKFSAADHVFLLLFSIQFNSIQSSVKCI